MRTGVPACILICALAACGEVKSNTTDASTPDSDPCASATCECTTATEDTDCGAHKFCDTTGPGRSCACVAGYTDGVNGCVFTGTIKDPGFASATDWTPANGALLNTTAVGGVDPGEASFLTSALCGLGHVKQSVEMPSFRKAEPLVLELTYKNQLDFNTFDQVLMGVSLGGGWFPLPQFFDANFHSTRICLSEGGYAPAATTGKGAPVVFALGPYQKPSRCPNSTINFSIDHAGIVVANAGECGTVPGQGANFDAESSGGWTFTVSGSSQGGFVNGIGASGTKAARVVLGARCDGAQMETFFNVPNVANPALDMFVGTGAGANATISFGNGLFQMSGPPSGTSATLHACLPPSLRGQTMSLQFSLNGGSGACNQILNHEVFADNVRVVDDASCASDAGFSNGGLEQGGAAFGSFGFIGSSTSAAVVRTTAGQAHGGTHFLSLESNGRCSSSGWAMLATVPPSSGTAGPALKFFAKVGVNPDASTSVFASGASQTLTEGGGYTPYTVCLDPLFVGRPQLVTISHQGGSGLCDNSNYVQQTALIDDVTVTTDPICPAQ